MRELSSRVHGRVDMKPSVNVRMAPTIMLIALERCLAVHGTIWKTLSKPPQIQTYKPLYELFVFPGKLANVISYKSYNCSEAVAPTPDDLRLAPQPFQKLHLLGLLVNIN